VSTKKPIIQARFRTTKDLARNKAKKAPYKTALIVCEDSKSCPNYLQEVRKYYRLHTTNVIVVPSKGSAPISVVDHAIEIARTTPDIDYVICVFDRDAHASYTQAINKLQNHKPKRSDKSKPEFCAITSTPCYELWLLLHFRYSTKSYSPSGSKSAADNLIKDLLVELPSYLKSTTVWFNEIIDKQTKAITYAKQLQKHNETTQSTNPSTNMHQLIELLMNIKK
jgi:hypothetical protein